MKELISSMMWKMQKKNEFNFLIMNRRVKGRSDFLSIVFPLAGAGYLKLILQNGLWR